MWGHLPLKKRPVKQCLDECLMRDQFFPRFESDFYEAKESNDSLPLDLSCNSPFDVITRCDSSPVVSDPLSPASTLSYDSTDTYRCNYCDKEFTSRNRHRAHHRRHLSKDNGRYRCHVCHKTFVQKSSLTTHNRIHSGEKPYQCADCDDKFSDYSTFIKHKRVHSGEKPYRCPLCDRSFSQSGNMHRHLKSIHNHTQCLKV